jgi:asparagine synthase (glutamine-hydrolysing)
MCGIAGILSKAAPLDEPSGVAAMLHAQRHRGPDDSGSFYTATLGLGMVRLSILDLKSPNLCPLVYSGDTGTASHVLVYNGELYNYVELRDELIGKGHVFATTNDGEVLLHAYLEWGEACLDRFNGMFAFALADLEKDLLFLARDIAGEKPLYYCEQGGRFYFASEIKALLTQIPLPEINTTDEFKAFEYMTGAETLFEGILALRPGHKLVVRGLKGNFKGRRESEYWSLVDHLYDLDPAQAVDELDGLLQDSIRLRLRADVPWGVYLSGGIDSSLIAALAKPQIVFSNHFPYGPRYDELRYAELMARTIGAEHVIVRPTREDFERHLDNLIYHLDQPVGSFSAFPLYMLARTARERVKIVLSGEGVDELFSGYTRYLLPWHDQLTYERPELQNYNSLLDFYYKKPLDRFARLLNRGMVSDEVVKSVITPHFSQFSDLRHSMGYTDYRLMLVTLLHMEDRAAAAFGIENRAPFLDKRIVAFAFSIPGDMKIRGHVTKWIVKEVARRHLPAEIVERTDKQGLIAPINIWMNFRGQRGEFDRNGYNKLCMERWLKVFFQEQRFKRH